MLGASTSDAEILSRLDAAEDRLDIGGLLFFRYSAAAPDEGSPKDYSLSSPNFVNLYLDSKPSDQVRFYGRGRLSYDPTQGESSSSVALDQLWLKFNIARSLFVTAGKQRIKWGTGRFWNPTDYLNTETLDPLNGVTIFDVRLGVPLLKLHYPVESIGANLYAIASVDSAQHFREVGGALRAEFVVGTSEISASLVARRKTPLRAGLDYSGALGPVDVKVEAALQHGVKTPFFRGEYDTSPLSIDEFDIEGVPPEDLPDVLRQQLPEVLARRLPERYSREDELLPQVVVGMEYGRNYSDEDAVYLGVEYFYNSQGYADASLYPVLFQEGAFRPFYAGRHYGAIYAALPSPGSWNDTTFTASSIANLSDQSLIARLDYSMNVLTYLTLNAFLMGNFGRSGELNYSYSQEPLLDPALAAEIPPENLSEIPSEVLNGVRVIGPMASAGAVLRYVF
jgi:hypothetical protein